MNEQRDDYLYKAIPLTTRILIRIIIKLLNILNIRLKPFNMAPRFSIHELPVGYLEEPSVDTEGSTLQ